MYARVSSARQKKNETIGSQIEALRAHAADLGLEVPEQWIFCDDGHSGATLIRPALERLRDLIAGVDIDVVLCYSPDRLARKFAYQALLIEEFTRAGVRVEFVRGPRGDTPEDQLMVQFQGMFAEYEKAQIMERYRRGKTHRAKSGSVNVLGGAPFGYRYLRKTDHSGAVYEIAEHEATLVAEMFRRYADDGASIADLTRWLTDTGTPTRTGKTRWDRSVIWGMLRNPAYAGRAVFGKTKVVHESADLNRVARLAGRSTPTASKTVDRPREEWIEIAVPAIVSQATFDRVAARLAENKRTTGRGRGRGHTESYLLQGLSACARCGYGYYRTATRTTNKRISYYRCLGSDNYRYEGGRVCDNKPVRADYLDDVVWDHLTALLADPALIRTEIDKRLDTAKSSDPVVAQRKRLDTALAKTRSGIAAMIEAFGEQLITIDELRARMPELRARETSLRNQIGALDAQQADREGYLALASDLEGFLAQLRSNAETATVDDRRRVVKLLVKDVLIGPEKITIRHRIPLRERTNSGEESAADTDTEGEHCQLRWGRNLDAMRSWHGLVVGLFATRRGADTTVARSGRLSLLINCDHLTYAAIFHGWRRNCTDPACHATTSDDGSWRKPYDSAPILDHAHTPSYPFDAPQPGDWSFHS
ncbi:recombinase family protein [Nocardia terpenica]|nr:recombinase family protein [Nocardia terpenica]